MPGTRDFPRIKQVRALIPEASAPKDQGADCHDVVDHHWINGNMLGEGWPIANPMSVYPEYQAYRKSWGINAIGTLVVEVEATDGTIGVGVTIGGAPGCYIVEQHFSKFVEGEDPRNIERMWDKMWRASQNYGRKGLTLQALSAVDLALWDLLGKIRNEPVYALLGGATKPGGRLAVYCTGCRPEVAKELGFIGAKIPCPYGPADGDEGFRKNIEFCKKAREKVGPDFPLMLDCYMALTAPYAIKLGKAISAPDLNFKWMEEFCQPDDYAGYREVYDALQGSGLLLTTGEHEYTRWGFHQLLSPKPMAHILQPDVTWCGGITEARRVVQQAAAYGVMVIPHGSGPYSYHLQQAFTNCPISEFINLHPDCTALLPYFGGLFEDEPMPKDGWMDIPDRPGFGLTLKRDGLVRPYERPAKRSEDNVAAIANQPPPKKPRMPF